MTIVASSIAQPGTARAPKGDARPAEGTAADAGFAPGFAPGSASDFASLLEGATSPASAPSTDMSAPAVPSAPAAPLPPAPADTGGAGQSTVLPSPAEPGIPVGLSPGQSAAPAAAGPSVSPVPAASLPASRHGAASRAAKIQEIGPDVAPETDAAMSLVLVPVTPAPADIAETESTETPALTPSPASSVTPNRVEAPAANPVNATVPATTAALSPASTITGATPAEAPNPEPQAAPAAASEGAAPSATQKPPVIRDAPDLLNFRPGAAGSTGGTNHAAGTDRTDQTDSAATILATPATPGDPLDVAPVPAAPPLTVTPPTAITPTAAPTSVPQPLATQLARPILSLQSAGPGTHLVTVKIAPDDLGPVTVRAHLAADSIRIELIAPTDQSRDALRAILPDLRRDLAQGGMPSSLGISTASDAAPSSPGGDGAGQSQSRPHAPGEQLARPTPTFDRRGSAAANSSAPAQARASGALASLDVLA